MSVGITISSESDVNIEGYYQNLAAEFDTLTQYFQRDGLDLSPFLFDPESQGVDEEELREMEYEEDEIAYNLAIATDDYHPIATVLDGLKRALELSRGYGDDRFSYGKGAFISDLEELIEAITPHAESGITIQLVRA
jgi:hypothetical protein